MRESREVMLRLLTSPGHIIHELAAIHTPNLEAWTPEGILCLGRGVITAQRNIQAEKAAAAEAAAAAAEAAAAEAMAVDEEEADVLRL